MRNPTDAEIWDLFAAIRDGDAAREAEIRAVIEAECGVRFSDEETPDGRRVSWAPAA